MSKANGLYAFVLKGEIAQDCVRRELHSRTPEPEDSADRIRNALPLDLVDDDFLASASKMAIVYSVISAFENSARKFIQDCLLEKYGEKWWEDKVSKSIREGADKRKSEEQLHRYHASRGTSMIFYTQMGDLPTIIQSNWEAFSDYVPSVDWARQLFRAVELSRNVIMHSGDLSMNDIVRVGVNIRDWLQQVGG